MSQHSGRVKPGQGSSKKSYGGFMKTPETLKPPTYRIAVSGSGHGKPHPMGKGPMVSGKTVTKAGLPRKGR